MVKLDRKVKEQGEGLGKNLAHKAKKISFSLFYI
jgi:hypothetical protein